MVAYIRMEQILLFFPLVNFGIGWTARTKLLLSGLDMTLFTAKQTCDVSHHVTCVGTFSKWPSIKRQKKFVENLVAQDIVYLLIQDSLT